MLIQKKILGDGGFGMPDRVGKRETMVTMQRVRSRVWAIAEALGNHPDDEKEYEEAIDALWVAGDKIEEACKMVRGKGNASG